MKLREYQAKAVLASYGIAVPRGLLAKSAEEAGEAARRLGGPTVLKPQLGVKGRGKVGGIGFAEDPDSALAEARRLFGLEVHGETVRTLLVEERLAIAEELYAAVTVDYGARRPVLMASPDGGVDIEEVARTRPDRILEVPAGMISAPGPEELSAVASSLGENVAHTVAALYRVFRDTDAELVEINPLIRDRRGALFAADAVLNVNEDSLFRHEDLRALREEIPVEDPLAEEAAARSWTYIDLGGDIAILSSGAGLTMAILDLLQRAGGSAANFLDTAQIDETGIYDAFELLARAARARAVLVNIFAGLNRCDRLARGIRRYLGDHPAATPMVVRMIGNLEEEGHRILRQIGIEPVTRLEEAIERAVALAAGASA